MTTQNLESADKSNCKKQESTLKLLIYVLACKSFKDLLPLKIWKRWKSSKQIIQKRSVFHWLFTEAIEIVFVILPLVLIFRHYVFQASFVYSGSMHPTLKVKDRLIVNKFIYSFTEPKRLDITLFKSPYKDKKQFVKRLIGFPNETIEIKEGNVFINGKQLSTPGLNILRDYSNYGPVVIADNHYFVLGDNRGNSADSRFFGFVHRDDFIGKALFTFWPPNQVGILE